MDCAEVLKLISKGNPPLNVCVQGDDAYWCKKVLDAFVSLADSFDVCTAVENISLQELVCDLGTIPLLGEYRVIIVRSYAKPSAKDKKLFAKYIENPNPASILIFDCKCDLDGVEVVTCNKLKGSALYGEVASIISSFGKGTSNDVIAKLVEYCEADMSKIYTECQKLCAYVDKQITMADLDLCVEPDISYKTYNFINYIMNGDYVSCHDFLKKNSDTGMIILATLVKMYRFAFYVKSSDEFNTLAKTFDMKYSANAGRALARLYTSKELYNLLLLLYRLEFEIKSGVTPWEQALNLAIAEAIERRNK